jgi:hypothetical protein
MAVVAALTAAAVVLAPSLTSAHRAPALTKSLSADTRAQSLVVEVSGRHRACKCHYMPRLGYSGCHRHSGPSNWPVAC